MTADTTRRQPFNVSGIATIKHLNIRKEGPEDNKALATDIKLELTGIDRRLCEYFDDALAAFLWRGETNALIVRNAHLGPVKYGNEIEGASVTIDGTCFMGSTAKKFAIVPKDGGVIDLTFQATIYPSSDNVSNLSRKVEEGCHITVEGPPDLFTRQSATAAHDEPMSQPTDDDDEPPATKASRVPIKYKNRETGETWSGRGLQPKWFRAAMDAGRRIEEFEVSTP